MMHLYDFFKAVYVFSVVLLLFQVHALREVDPEETDWRLKFVDKFYNEFHGETTFRYSIVLESEDLMEWILGVPSCPEIDVLDAYPLTAPEIVRDDITGIHGIKWSDGQTKDSILNYEIVVRGQVDSENIPYAVVGRDEFSVDSIRGPSCFGIEEVVCDAGGPYVAECIDNEVRLSLTASASEQAVRFEWHVSQQGASLSSISSVNPLLSLPLDLCQETVYIELTVFGHDEEDECEAEVTFEDFDAPVFQGLYVSDTTVEIDDIPAAPFVTAIDDCDPNVDVKYREERSEDNYGSFILERTWTARDFCGNRIAHMQNIFVQDTTPPEIFGIVPDTTVECGHVPEPCKIDVDDYSDDVSVDFKEIRIDGECKESYRLIRTWTAIDPSGNKAIDGNTITVQDIVPPVLMIVHDNTEECDNLQPVPHLTPTDNCGGAVSLDLSEVQLGDDETPNDYTIIRTWTAIDDCGNEVCQRQSIKVEDTTKPILDSVDQDVTVECDNFPTPYNPDVVDNCDSTISVVFYEEQIDGSCPFSYVSNHIWSATDLSGNTARVIQRITVLDTIAPKTSGLPPAKLTVSCDSIPEFELTSTDNCDDELDITVQMIDRVEGSSETDYTIHRLWYISDLCGNMASHDSEIIVEDTTSPILEGIPSDITVSCESVPSVSNTAVNPTDNCDSICSIVLEEEEIRVNGSCPFSYSLIRTWTVVDCSGNFDQKTQTIVVLDTEAPTISEVDGDIIVQSHQIPETPTIHTIDNCDLLDVLVVFQETRIDGHCETEYTLIRKWEATDSCGNTKTHVQTIHVEDTMAPYLFDIPSDVTKECSNVDLDQPGDVTALDCNGEFDIDLGEPAIVRFSEVLTNGSCANIYTLNRTWLTSDDCGNTRSESQIITVEDTTDPEYRDLPDDLTLEVEFPNIPPVADVIVFDNCGAPKIDFIEKVIAGVCTNSYTLERQWNAADFCGNIIAPLIQEIVVKDTTPPDFNQNTLPVKEITVECDSVPEPSELEAFDNDDSQALIEFKQTISDWACLHEYIIIRYWIALDQCSNQNTFAQTIQVVDSVEPTIEMEDGEDSITVECTAPENSVFGVDNCDLKVLTFLSDETTEEFSDDDDIVYRVITRSWSAFDACGNEGTLEQIITLEDTTPPLLKGIPPDTTVECDAIPPVPIVLGIDECDGEIEVEFEESENHDASSCESQFWIFRRWTAYDNALNLITDVQTIKIWDITFPNITSGEKSNINLSNLMTLDNTTVECDSVPKPNPFVVAIDNCDEFPDLSFRETRVNSNDKAIEEFLLIWEWTAVDECGNEGMLTQTITVVDTTPPEIVGIFEETRLTVECDSVPEPVDPNTIFARDNCYDVDIIFEEFEIGGSCSNEYTLIRNWSATDGSTNNHFFSQTIIVVDTSGPFIEDNDIFSEFLSVPFGQIPESPENVLDVYDNCMDDDNEIKIQCRSDIINGRCSTSYTQIYTCTAIDDCGHTTVVQQTIEVVDESPPVLYPQPIDKTIDCEAMINLNDIPEVSTEENNVIVAYHEIKEEIQCRFTFKILRIWTARDDCDNSVVWTQIIQVEDITAPSLFEVPEDTTIICGLDTEDVFEITATDNCDTVTTITFEQSTNYDDKLVIRIWSVTDSCGNNAVAEQSITIKDGELTINFPDDVIVDANTIPTDHDESPKISFPKNCYTNVTERFDDTEINGSCENEWIILRKWSVHNEQDDDIIMHTQTIHVVDNDPPMLSSKPPDLTLDGQLSEPPMIVAFDALDGKLDVIYTEKQINATVWRRNWLAEDKCGNKVIHNQQLSVLNATPSQIPGFPAHLNFVECGDEIIPTEKITAKIKDLSNEDAIITVEESSKSGSCGNEYIVSRTWTITENGLSITDTMISSVIDTTFPKWEKPLPETVLNVECDELLPQNNIQAQDNCGECDISMKETRFKNEGIRGGHRLERIWIATDNCGHNIDYKQNVYIFEPNTPVFNDPIPADLTVECGNLPLQEKITAHDGCGSIANVIMQPSVKINIDCTNNYTLLYQWLAISQTGKSSVHAQTIVVVDTQSPELRIQLMEEMKKEKQLNNSENDFGTENITAECDNIPLPLEFIAFDSCAGPLTPTFREEYEGGTSDDQYQLIRMWTVTDGCDHTSYYSQTITVQDTKAPTINGLPKNEQITIECNDNIDKVIGSWSVEDNCDPDPIIRSTKDLTDGSCYGEYTVTRTWISIDRNGNSVSETRVITIVDSNGPSISGVDVDSITVQCDDVPEANEFSVSAIDDCQNNVDIISTDTILQGTSINNYVITKTWTASDACGNTVTLEKIIHIVDSKSPIFIDIPADEVISCSEVSKLNADVQVHDNCDIPTITNSSAHVRGSCEHSFILLHTWVATDLDGNSVSYIQTVTVEDVDPPVFDTLLPSELFVECDEIPSDSVSALDACAGKVRVSISEETILDNEFSSYSIVRLWESIDLCSNSIRNVQTIHVSDTTPPEISNLDVHEFYECNSIPTIEDHNVEIEDNCDPNPILEFVSHFKGIPCDENYEIQIKWIASDMNGNVAIRQFNVPVIDTMPPQLLDFPSDETVSCDSIPLPATVSATDCHDDMMADLVQQPREDISSNTYILVRIWSAIDKCDNKEMREQTITVVDEEAPELQNIPPNMNYTCHQIPPHSQVIAIDNCDMSPHIAFAEDIIPGNCNWTYMVYITWTASDDSGNIVTATVSNRFSDDEAPIFVSPPDKDITVSCASVPSPQTLRALDNCDPYPQINVDINTIPGRSLHNYVLQFKHEAVDACGNMAQFIQTILVEDNEAPVFSNIPIDLTVACDNVPSIPPILVSVDNCDSNPLVNFTENRINGSCVHSYILIRSWATYDVSGNAQSTSQTIYVHDMGSPQFNQYPQDTQYECDSVPQAPVLTAYDMCSRDPLDVIFDEIVLMGNRENHQYKLTWYWETEDTCGHKIQHTQTLQIVDTTPPVIFGGEKLLEFEVGSTPLTAISEHEIDATDNCDLEIILKCDEKQEDGSCPDNYVFYRTCTTVDLVGNVANFKQTIIVRDTIAPSIIMRYRDQEVEFDSIPSLEEAKMETAANDNSGIHIVVDVEEEIVERISSTQYTLKRIFVAQDRCGNEANEVIHIIVGDTTPPCFNKLPHNISVDCDAIPPPCTLTTIDEELPVSFEERDVVTKENLRKIIRVWSASDLAGNYVEHEQTLSVMDTFAPLFSRYPSDETLHCASDIQPSPKLFAMDNCDERSSIKLNYQENTVEFNSADVYVLTRLWTAVDKADNWGNHTQSITVRDDEAPVLSRRPSNKQVACDAVPDPPPNGAVDNCDDDVFVDFKEVKVNGSCPHTYTIYRTWTSIDRNGNKASYNQSLDVVDFKPPSLIIHRKICLKPNGKYIAFSNAEQTFFDVKDNCGHSAVTLLSCNSTQGTYDEFTEPTYDLDFSSSCYYDDESDILYVLGESLDDTERTYWLYAEAIDECDNSVIIKTSLWVPHDVEQAAQAGYTCKEPTLENPFEGEELS